MVRGRFFNNSRGVELFGQNDNGVPIRLILINHFSPDEPDGLGGFRFNEDPGLIANAVITANPYEFVGSDSDADDRNLRLRHSFNFFRLGEFGESRLPSTNVQRRVVFVNGSTRELLFSLTPTGSSAGGVAQDFVGIDDELIGAINSMELTPQVPDDLSIEVTDLQFEGTNITILFESTEGLSDFSIVASATLTDDFGTDLIGTTEIEETSPGSYQATVTALGSAFPEQLFFRVEF